MRPELRRRIDRVVSRRPLGAQALVGDHLRDEGAGPEAGLDVALVEELVVGSQHGVPRDP
jgi:hypothetical protein